MNRYCLGFLLYGDYFAAVKKQFGPPAIRGKWNGIGGKIDVMELPLDGMIREFREETGLHIPDWRYHGVHSGPDWELCIFAKEINGYLPLPSTNDVGEELTWFNFQRRKEEMTPNLLWMIPLVRDKDNICINAYERPV